VVPQDFVVTVERGQEKGMEQSLTVQDELIAPVKEGQACGEMVVKLNGKEIAKTPLVAECAVPRLGVFASIWRSLREIINAGD
jgi:D-alanyl-D-alanine carboxypeptidase (penicillin-binding protein 5/6)